jgi:TIR domain
VSDKIFINYRRGEDSGFAQALFIRLEQTFSSSSLFMDVDSIAPGEDFVRRLESQIAQCDVLLAVIGKGWIDASNERGGRRLEDPDDFVRIEIASALKQNKRVIPVLLHDATMPRPEQLPPELRPLARRHAVRLTHERFRVDTEGLIKALQRTVGDTTAAPRSEPQAQIPAVAAVSLIGDPDTPDQTPVPVGTAVTPINQRADLKLGIAAGIEKLAERYEAINFGVISLLGAFLLVFGSYLAGVLDVEYTTLHKQVGFGWAPNWSFNYLVLFVAYNCLLCAFAHESPHF